MRTSTEMSRRGQMLFVGVVAGAGVFLVPAAILSADQQSLVVIVAEAVACGVILGLGRQGIDLLAMRLLIVSAVVISGWIAISHWLHHAAVCTSTLGCGQGLVLGTLFGAAVCALLLAVIAVPIAMVWNKGFAGLAPEFRRPKWQPRTWWQWSLLVVCVLTVLLVLQLALGIPTPP